MAFSSERRVNSSLAVYPTEPMVMTRVCVCAHTRAHVSVGGKLCVLIKPGKAERQGGGLEQGGKSAS